MSEGAGGHENLRIATFYDDLLAEHGHSPRAVDWGSRASQQARFHALVEIGDLAHSSVLDVGCGLADLLAYLESRAIPATYTGYDIAPAMLEAARRRFPDAELKRIDLLADPVHTPRFDFVLASGIFNLRTTDSYAYLEAMARRMYRVCRRGVAFNSLSTMATIADPDQFLADPMKVLDLCLSITPRVVLRHDYLPHDFTVYLYKDRHGSRAARSAGEAS